MMRRAGTCKIGVALVFALFTLLTGCAFVLLPRTLPSQQRLKIVSASPDRCIVRTRIPSLKEYPVAADGRVAVDIASESGGCNAYVFGIRVGRGVNPVTAKRIEIVRAGKTVRRLSLMEIAALPTDADAYHLLKLK